jgi:hypothetical protein
MALFSPSVTKGCMPLEVNFSNQSVMANSFLWNFGNGETSSEKNPRYQYKSAGKYIATLTIQDEDGTKASYAKEIVVYEKPSADFSIDIEQSDIQSRQIVFLNNSKGAISYSWELGDKNFSHSQKPIHTYSSYADYTVTLVALSENGCADTARLMNKFIEKNFELAFPLNFRPNPNGRSSEGFYDKGDAGASIFYPSNYGAENFELNISAPNGLTVFKTNTIKQGWNGYLGSRIAPSGVYNYRASGIYPNGKKFEINGQVKVFTDEQYLE